MSGPENPSQDGQEAAQQPGNVLSFPGATPEPAGAEPAALTLDDALRSLMEVVQKIPRDQQTPYSTLTYRQMELALFYWQRHRGSLVL